MLDVWLGGVQSLMDVNEILFLRTSLHYFSLN